jgi:hypothetical protein
MLCQNCFADKMVKPTDSHPSYVVCPSCGAIELTYEPMRYQEELHTIPYESDGHGGYKPQIIATFGKLNLPN